MEITDENKNEIKDQINTDINNILEKHELPYRMDGLSVMKTSKGTSFLGNVRVHDPNKVKAVRAEIESYLDKFGKVVKHIVSVCIITAYGEMRFAAFVFGPFVARR